jgi:ABC-type xylose transport system permease subunit
VPTKARIPALIATLGTLGMALGASYLIADGKDVHGIPLGFARTVGFGLAPGGVPWLVLVAVVTAAVAGLVLTYTRFGLRTYAIGSHAEGARRVGIPVDAHLVKVYGLSGMLAGVAGCLSLAHFTTTTITGHTADNLSVIAAVVLGGASLFGGSGTVAGTVIGLLIPAVLQSGFVTIRVNPYWQYIAVGGPRTRRAPRPDPAPQTQPFLDTRRTRGRRRILARQRTLRSALRQMAGVHRADQDLRRHPRLHHRPAERPRRAVRRGRWHRRSRHPRPRRSRPAR